MAKEEHRFVNAAALIKYLNISRATLDNMMKRNQLPRPVKLGPRFVRWDMAKVKLAMNGWNVNKVDNLDPADLERMWRNMSNEDSGTVREVQENSELHDKEGEDKKVL